MALRGSSSIFVDDELATDALASVGDRDGVADETSTDKAGVEVLCDASTASPTDFGGLGAQAYVV